jgi:hypothetical protein
VRGDHGQRAEHRGARDLARPRRDPDHAGTATATAADPAGKDTAATPPPPPAAEIKLVPLDLSPVGDDWKGWSVDAPEGATVKESFGAAEIVLGEGFQLDIRLAKADVAGAKKESEANDVNKVKGYVLDQPDVMLFESEVMGQTEFHLYGGVKSGEVDFTCEDVKGPRHSKADAELMWKTCQSIAKK